MDKKCARCQTLKPISDFRTRTVKGRIYPSFLCTICHREYDRERQKGRKRPPPTTGRLERKRKNRLKKDKEQRMNNVDTARYILSSSRASDRLKQRSNDLDKDFIGIEINKPCTYCGDMESKMTLDRIDNEIGHMKDNVLPACYRCNMTRSNMPFSAWLIIAEAMRRAREQGEFGDWRSKPIRNK